MSTIVARKTNLHSRTPQEVLNSFGARIKTITPVLSTLAYAVDDVLFETKSITDAVNMLGGTATLNSVCLTLIDDDTSSLPEIDLIFFKNTQDLTDGGSANDPEQLSDDGFPDIIGYVHIDDYIILANGAVAVPQFNPIVMQSADDADCLWVSAIIRTAKTFDSSNAITLHLGFIQD